MFFSVFSLEILSLPFSGGADFSEKHVVCVYELSDGNPMSDESWSFISPLVSLMLGWLERALGAYQTVGARGAREIRSIMKLTVVSMTTCNSPDETVGLMSVSTTTSRPVHGERGGLHVGLPRRCPPPRSTCARALAGHSSSPPGSMPNTLERLSNTAKFLEVRFPSPPVPFLAT